MTKKIQITGIYCYNSSEHGHDEVYVISQADAGFAHRYPSQLATYVSLKKGHVWHPQNPDLILEFENEVLVTLWDQDLSYDPALATYLISYDYTKDNVAKSTSVGIKNPNGGEYKIEIKILA